VLCAAWNHAEKTHLRCCTRLQCRPWRKHGKRGSWPCLLRKYHVRPCLQQPAAARKASCRSTASSLTFFGLTNHSDTQDSQSRECAKLRTHEQQAVYLNLRRHWEPGPCPRHDCLSPCAWQSGGWLAMPCRHARQFRDGETAAAQTDMRSLKAVTVCPANRAQPGCAAHRAYPGCTRRPAMLRGWNCMVALLHRALPQQHRDLLWHRDQDFLAVP
jgi:hypothetical protein